MVGPARSSPRRPRSGPSPERLEITSTKIKVGEASVRGYRREDLYDAWQRYCPEPPPHTSGTSGTSGTSQVSDPVSGSASEDGSGTEPPPGSAGSGIPTTNGTGTTPSEQEGSAGSGGSAYTTPGNGERPDPLPFPGDDEPRGWCDICADGTLRLRDDGAWRHEACEGAA